MKTKHMLAAISTCVLALVIQLIPSCGVPPGRMLLDLKVRQNDEFVLRMAYDVSDTSSIDEIIDGAGEPMFFTEIGDNFVDRFQANQDSVKVGLDGIISIEIFHVHEMKVGATLEGIQLIRSNANSDNWHLAAETVERMKATVSQ